MTFFKNFKQFLFKIIIIIIIGRLQSRRLRASSSHNDLVPIQTACPGQSCCLCWMYLRNRVRCLSGFLFPCSGDLKRRKGLAWTAFWNWNVCGDALTSLSPPRSSYLILPVSLSFYMAVSRGSCRKQWKARSMPLVPHVIELCSTSRELIGCPMLKSMI